MHTAKPREPLRAKPDGPCARAASALFCFSIVQVASPSSIHVLIAGAGPSGLVLAHWLTRLGVSVRLIDSAAESGTTSRALAVQARTLEFYRQIGLADEVVEHGVRVGALNLWVSGKREAHAAFGTLGEGVSPYPFALVYPQDQHERLLARRLSELGVEIERRTEFVGFEETAGRLIVRLRRPDGSTETCETAFLAGCDGAHSAVRGALGIGFEGGTYDHLFYIADVEATGPVMNGELHVALDRSEFLAVFPLKGGARASSVRSVMMSGPPGAVVLVRREQVGHRTARNRGDPGELVLDLSRAPSGGGALSQGPRLSARRCRAHPQPGRRSGDEHRHRRCDQSRLEAGRGAARHSAGAAILDSYEPERIAFARRLVETTDRAFTRGDERRIDRAARSIERGTAHDAGAVQVRGRRGGCCFGPSPRPP